MADTHTHTETPTVSPEERRRHERRATSRREERREVREIVAGGTGAEAIAGGAAVVLAILGLVGAIPFYMLTIATIAAGAALFIEGAAMAGAHAKVAREGLNGDTRNQAVGGGMSAQALGGAAGMVLGILALFGVAPFVLVPAAAIVMGGAMLVGGPAHTEIPTSVIETGGTTSARVRHATSESVKGAGAAMALAGLGAVTLGILVLADIGAPMTLSLVAILAIGAAALLAGSALMSRVGALVS